MQTTDTYWVICPVCSQKTHTKIRQDTVLRHFPLFCPKCKRECLIDVQNRITTIVTEPDA